jgi:hypothetical protein
VNLFIPKKSKNRSHCIRYLTGSSHLIKMLEMFNLENDFLLASEMLEGWCLIGGIFAPVLTCRYKYTGNIKFRLRETNFVLEYRKYEDLHCLGISSNGNCQKKYKGLRYSSKAQKICHHLGSEFTKLCSRKNHLVCSEKKNVLCKKGD